MSLLSAARDVALAPLAGLYAAGGAINAATGGETETYSIWKAARGGGSTEAQTSNVVLGSSLVRGHDVELDDGTTVRRLRPQVPVVNPAGAEVLGDVVEDATTFAGEVAGSAVSGASEGLGKGLGVKGILVIGAAGAGALYLLSKR